ncbi:MAG: hypothetical protein AAFZ38_06160 [Myxococcota bacterium]
MHCLRIGLVFAVVSAGCYADIDVFGNAPEPLELATGQYHSMALVEGGLVGWGSNRGGALGEPSAPVVAVPRVVDPGPWTEVHLGDGVSCAIDALRVVSCLGRGEFGQLAQGNRRDRSAFIEVVLPGPVAQLSTRYSHVCAIVEPNELWCWGRNEERQLARADELGFVDALEPVRVAPQRDWIQVSVGQGHSCAIDTEGGLWCWGRNTQGQAGAGAEINADVARVAQRSDFIAVRAEQNHSCALSVEGQMWCFGENAFGELGDGTTELRTSPVLAASGERFVDLELGTFNTCGRREDGVLRCWGMLEAGVLGTGLSSDPLTTEPITMNVEPPWTSLRLGRVHSCGRREDGSLWCSGVNDASQLGVDIGEFSSVFQRVPGQFDRYFEP